MKPNFLQYLSLATLIKAVKEANLASKYAVMIIGIVTVIEMFYRFGISLSTLIFSVIILIIFMISFLIFSLSIVYFNNMTSIIEYVLNFCFIITIIIVAVFLPDYFLLHSYISYRIDAERHRAVVSQAERMEELEGKRVEIAKQLDRLEDETLQKTKQLNRLEGKRLEIAKQLDRLDDETLQKAKRLERLEELERLEQRQQQQETKESKSRPPIIPDTPLYPVWYGTNRQFLDSTDSSRGYTSESDNHINYGICYVSIPESHQFGSIGSNWMKRFFYQQDDRLKIHKIYQLIEKDFWKNINIELNKDYFDERTILLYIHGYNVSFEEAVLRAAQIGFDLKVPGITVLYSWPSKGTFSGYEADSESIQISERYIVEFLTRLAKDTNAHRVHIIAHSMGNRGLLQAIQRISQQAENIGGIKFGQIFLAAPDINTTLFKEVAHHYPQVSERTTLYVSSRDKALGVSYWMHDFPRIGFTPPITVVEGVDTVEVQNIDLTMLGHGYFAEAAAVLYDMYTLIRNDIPPQNRARLLSKKMSNNLYYWIIGQ